MSRRKRRARALMQQRAVVVNMVNERESNAALPYIKPYVIRRWVGLAATIDLIRI